MSRRQSSEILRSVCIRLWTVDVQVPPIQNRETTADVAQGNREVDRLVGDLDDASPARDLDPMLVGEPDLLNRVLET